MSNFKTNEEIYGFVMYDFFMVNHFLEMLQSWSGAFCKVITDWHPLKLNLSGCFWYKLLYQTSLSIVVVQVKFGQIWAPVFCLHFLYVLQRMHKRGIYLCPRCLFRHGLDLSFSFHYFNVMHTQTHTSEITQFWFSSTVYWNSNFIINILLNGALYVVV